MNANAIISRWLSIVGIAAAAIIVGTTSILQPLAIVGAVGAIVAGCLMCWVLGTTRALALIPLLLIIGETKFRNRDPSALLSGGADSNVMFELAVYAVIGVIIIINALTHFVAGDKFAKPRPLERGLFAYVCIALLSTGWSVSPSITAVRSFQQLILFLAVFTSVRIIEPRRVLRLLGLQMLAYVLVCTLLAICIPSFSGTRISVTQDIPRFSWFAVHPVSAANEAGMAATFIAAWAMYEPLRWRARLAALPLWAYFISLVAIVIATRTRTGLFSLVGAVAVLYGIRHRTDFKAKAIGVGVVAAIALSHVVTPELMNGAQSFVLRGQDTKEFATLTGRTDLWKVSLGMFTLRPLLGYGFVASRAELLQVFSWSGEAHNALVESLLDLGAVGALCVWVPLINGIMRSAKRLSDWTASEDGAFACILGALVFILLDGMATASFAGYLSYDPAVMMTVLIVTAALDRRVASHREAGLSAVSPTAPQSVPVEYGLRSHI